MRRLVLIVVLLGFALVPAVNHPTPAHAQGNGNHVVQLGETLYSIARYYGVSAEAIAAANRLINPDYIYEGQSLMIPGSHMPVPGGDHPPRQDNGGPRPGPGNGPGPSGSYTVQLGDSLYAIAARFDVTLEALVAANNLPNANYIFAGQVLHIPGGHDVGQPGPDPDYGHPVEHDYGQPVDHDYGHQIDYKPGNCGFSYSVRYGDTLSGVAAGHGTTVYAVASANGLRYPYMIYAGQRLHIPCDGGTPRYVVNVVQKGPSKPVYKPAYNPRPKPRPGTTKVERTIELHPATCAPEVSIARPLERQEVDGLLYIIGTANIPDFQFYKLEYAMGRAALDSNFASIGDVVRSAASNTILGTWYVGGMPAGEYILRLTAVDNRGQFVKPCSVHITIEH